MTTIEIPASSAQAFDVGEGDLVRIVDVAGSQVADVVTFDATDHAEFFSQAYTRVMLERGRIGQGDRLYSNRMAPLLEIVADDVGVHDITFPPCSTRVFELMFDIHGRTGCREHLGGVLAPYGIDAERITDPFNAFMHTEDMTILLPTSTAGDAVTLRALRPLIMGVSACAGDMNDCNAGVLTDIRVEITPAGR